MPKVNKTCNSRLFYSMAQLVLILNFFQDISGAMSDHFSNSIQNHSKYNANGIVMHSFVSCVFPIKFYLYFHSMKVVKPKKHLT